MKVFETEQFLPGKSLAEVFAFFADEMNLEKITPPWLHFKVLGKDTPSLQVGTRIQYKLRIHGIPCRWETLIAQWQPPFMFVDTQTKGPYQLWHHTHTFTEVENGIKMNDVVKFQLPLGWLGEAVAGRWVENDVKKIFAFRREKIETLLLR